MQGYGPADIKFRNREVIYHLFREQPIWSRTALAKAASMSFPTVSKAISFLSSRGIVLETIGSVSPSEGPGRKGRLLRFNPDAYLALGFSFEGRYARFGLINLVGDCKEMRSVEVLRQNNLPDLDSLAQPIHELLQHTDTPVLGAGIGYPAVIDPDRGVILKDTVHGIFEERDFRSIFPKFCETLDMPFYLENDVNQACLGEHAKRALHEQADDLVYLWLGTGLGAGIIMDGKLRGGASRRTGEVGPLQMPEAFVSEHIAPDDVLPLERRVNLSAVKERFGDAFRIDVPPQEPLRSEICDMLAPPLSFLIAAMASVLDIPDFTLAGLLPDLLGNSLRNRITSRLSHSCHTPVHLSSPSDPNAGVTGGAVTVFRHRLPECFRED